jgi:3-deoxy-manno-octulosonate cytidylyltransferase (CMP-KDO synthetase)
VVIGVIPARWGSVRFPGKPLAPILGRPMLQRVYERGRQCRLLDEILIATDDSRIAETAEGFGARVVMTSSKHMSGTDRVAEAVSDSKCSVVVNIQGDEPLLRPAAVDMLASAMLSDPSVPMATLMCKITAKSELGNPSCVKVVIAGNGDAVYFSRSAIPYVLNERPFDYRRHIGVYCYRRDALALLVNSPPMPLEMAEGLEQLRALELGMRIRMVEVDGWGPAVDTPEDVERVETILREEESRSVTVKG